MDRADIDNIVEVVGDEAKKLGLYVKNHFLLTVKVFKFWVTLNMLTLVFYVAASQLAADEVGQATGGLYSIAWYMSITVFLLCALFYTVVLGRLGWLGIIGSAIERITIGVPLAISKLVAVVTPDAIGGVFDKEGVFIKDLQDKWDKIVITEAMVRQLKNYMGLVAVLLYVNFFVLYIPPVYPIWVLLLAILGITAVTYGTIAWDKDPFWIAKLQSWVPYATIAIILWEAAVKPIIAWYGLFGGWGSATYSTERKLFWAVTILTVIALFAKSGASWKLQPGVDGADGKLAFTVTNYNYMFAAVAVLLFSLMFGHLIVDQFIQDITVGGIKNFSIYSYLSLSTIFWFLLILGLIALFIKKTGLGIGLLAGAAVVLITGGIVLLVAEVANEVIAAAKNDLGANRSIGSITPDANGCIIKNPTGSCWTFNPGQFEQAKILPTDADFAKPFVTVSADGLTCTIIVPATAADGVKAVDSTSGKSCTIRAAQQFEVSATGTIMFSTDHPRTGPNGMLGWRDPNVDSPFIDKVGGLEFGIEDLQSQRTFAGAHYVGTAKTEGIPVFRVVERLIGYTDNNSGGFTVTVQLK